MSAKLLAQSEHAAAGPLGVLALRDPQIRVLFREAYKDYPRYNADDILEGVLNLPPPLYSVIGVWRDHTWKGFALMYAPAPPLSPHALLFSHYAKESADDRKVLNDAIVKQTRAWGCESFVAIDHWNKFDAFCRLFNDFGDGKYLGTEIEFFIPKDT